MTMTTTTTSSSSSLTTPTKKDHFYSTMLSSNRRIYWNASKQNCLRLLLHDSTSTATTMDDDCEYEWGEEDEDHDEDDEIHSMRTTCLPHPQQQQVSDLSTVEPESHLRTNEGRPPTCTNRVSRVE